MFSIPLAISTDTTDGPMIPVQGTRQMLMSGFDMLTSKQSNTLETLFANDEHVEAEARWRTTSPADS